MTGVLVLNATYEPLSIVSVRRAIVLLLKEKAEIIEATEALLRAERTTLPVPSVIRLVSYVRIPHRLSLPVTRRTVLARDNYTCQYCGLVFPKAELTIDHVVPRSHGGPHSWDNVVTACLRCNQHKGSRTPEQAHMSLLSRPSSPRYVALVLLLQGRAHASWDKYML